MNQIYTQYIYKSCMLVFFSNYNHKPCGEKEPSAKFKLPLERRGLRSAERRQHLNPFSQWSKGSCTETCLNEK